MFTYGLLNLVCHSFEVNIFIIFRTNLSRVAALAGTSLRRTGGRALALGVMGVTCPRKVARFWFVRELEWL
eukprot:SAG31_NODE_1739_length_7396_cov_3.063177_4_plen_71_part_00